MRIKAFYNEIDPYCCAWLSNLMDAGHITPGVISDASIEDIRPSDLAPFDRCHFFAGIGVWDYALALAGWGDRPVWTGSCPCQPFSAAGDGVGFADERHLWPAWHHLITQRKPSALFGEQVASLDGLQWLDLVHADMEDAGYAFAAADLCAAGIGAPHVRQRLFWCANTLRKGRQGHQFEQRFPVSAGAPFPKPSHAAADVGRAMAGDFIGLLPSDEPTVGLERSRTKAYGNAINAEAARVFIESVM